MADRKIAIVGTAPSWDLTPWHDPNVEIWSLNDAYNIDGFQRADAWYDLHPLDKFWMVPPASKDKKTVVFAHQVPPGFYVRPHGHLDWLATQPMPKWLHPSYQTQLATARDWPHAHAFPKREIEEAYGDYCTSSPQWMLAHALLQGVRDVQIYGIHLSTEQEYIDQRPGFEFLIGCLLGPGKRTMTRKNGVRRYESQDGVAVIPEASPILSSRFQYAFEPSPRRHLDPLKWELNKAEIKRNRTVTALRDAWGPIARFEEPIPNDPNHKTRMRWALTSTLQQELWTYDAMVADCQDTIARESARLGV